MNPFSLIVQGFTECRKVEYKFTGKDGVERIYPANLLKVKILGRDGELVDLDVRVTDELVEKFKMFDKKSFGQTFYMAGVSKLKGMLEYDAYNRKERKTVHELELNISTEAKPVDTGKKN